MGVVGAVLTALKSIDLLFLKSQSDAHQAAWITQHNYRGELHRDVGPALWNEQFPPVLQRTAEQVDRFNLQQQARATYQTQLSQALRDACQGHLLVGLHMRCTCKLVLLC